MVEPAENAVPEINLIIRVGTSEPTKFIAATTCARVVPAPTVTLVSEIIPSAKVDAVSEVVNLNKKLLCPE